jgi:hypothetical protein
MSKKIVIGKKKTNYTVEFMLKAVLYADGNGKQVTAWKFNVKLLLHLGIVFQWLYLR